MIVLFTTHLGIFSNDGLSFIFTAAKNISIYKCNQIYQSEFSFLKLKS